jgi:hypothetical protein
VGIAPDGHVVVDKPKVNRDRNAVIKQDFQAPRAVSRDGSRYPTITQAVTDALTELINGAPSRHPPDTPYSAQQAIEHAQKVSAPPAPVEGATATDLG